MELKAPATVREFTLVHKYGTIFGRVESNTPSVGEIESRVTDEIDVFVTGFDSNYPDLEIEVWDCLSYYDDEEVWLGKFPGIPTDDILVELMFWNIKIDPEKYTNNN